MANKRHLGLQRAQTERSPRDPRDGVDHPVSHAAMRPPPGLDEHKPTRGQSTASKRVSESTSKPLTTGSKLRSGITLTFPTDHERPTKGRLSNGSTVKTPEDTAPSSTGSESSRSASRADLRTPRSKSRTNGRRGNDPRQQRGSTGNLISPDMAFKKSQGVAQTPRSASSGQLSDGSMTEDELQQHMEHLKAAKQTRAWLVLTWLRHMEMEKDKADELSRQMAMQTQALMEEREKMKAEKDQLERSHNEMAARLQLLEGMLLPDEDLGPDTEDLSPGALHERAEE